MRGNSTKLGQALSSAAYTGPLAADYVRWWRAGIDNIVWRFSQEARAYDDLIREAAGDVEIDMLEWDDPVVLSDENLVESVNLVSARECVRVQDEYFPPEVPLAWVKITLAKEHADLADKVVFEDRVILEDDVA